LPVARPTDGELFEFGLRAVPSIYIDDLSELRYLGEAILSSLDELELDIKPHRVPGREGVSIANEQFAGRSDDPLNAVVRWLSLQGEPHGPLSGIRVGVKDSMAVAGAPMTCGSAFLTDYVPSRSCTVVRRLLAAGATVIAILNMDNFALSAGGETSAYGPTLNPFDSARTAGGSSGGSAAALHYDRFDLTFGTDQGGSVRVPASWCGVLGLKPTFGLVPYTGIASMDRSLDHVGPLARTVRELAAGLAAVAGPDGEDPRQCDPEVADYVHHVEEAKPTLRGTRMAMIREGCGEAGNVDSLTQDAFLAAIERFRSLGAVVDEVSIPEHLQAGAIGYGCLAEGLAATINSNGVGHHVEGHYDAEFAIAFARALRERPDKLPVNVRAVTIIGNYLRNRYSGSVYAAAQNARPGLRRAYDRALERYDFLVLPTTPYPAHLREPAISPSERVLRGWRMLSNTSAFNLSGHPALSLPAAETVLPVGVMVVGRRYAEADMLAMAASYEMTYGWLPK